MTRPAVSSHSTDSEKVVIHAVTQCAYSAAASISEVEDLTLSEKDKP